MIDVAISTWSLHTYFLNPEITGLRVVDFPGIARHFFGVRHVEIFEGDYAPDLSDLGFDHDRHAKEVRDACEQAGVRVVCLAGINDLAQENDEMRMYDRRRIVRLATHCETLGCPVIRVNTGQRRLDPGRAPRLIRELRDLSDALEGRPVVLALENHPHMLDTEADVALLLNVIEQVARENVRLCPDLGAIGPGLWRKALEQMAPLAAHVHLKPFVLDASRAMIGLEAYSPAVREILDGFGYRGAVTLEYLPSLDLLSDDLGTDSLVALLNLARVFDYPTAPDPTRHGGLSRPPGPNRQASRNAALSPTPGVLALLAEGCSQRLGAQIRIQDLATGRRVASGGVDDHALTDDGTPPASPSSDGPPLFCGLVARDPTANAECRKFHDRKTTLISEGRQHKPRVCICPMGLILLSVPIADEKTTYGLISCGPWIEKGTEGMIIDGIRRLTPPDLWQRLEDASRGVEAYSPQTLVQSRELLSELAGDLGELYKEREQTNRYLVRGPEVIQLLAQVSGDGAISVDEFVSKLEKPFKLFEEVVGFGYLALYCLGSAERDREVIRWLPLSPIDRQPPEIGLPPSQGLGQAEIRGRLKQAIERATDGSCLVPERRVSSEFVVFHYPTHIKEEERRLASILFEQFASEVNYIFASLHNLTEAETRRQELEIFIDRFKHAISSPLQGLSDRVWQLRRGIEGSRTLTFLRLRELVSDLRDFSTEAGNILDRFTGRIRVHGVGSLRPQLTFSRVDPTLIIEESVRKLSRYAARRGVRLEAPPSPSPPLLLEGDPDALAEVFDNLVENAAKFANEGSRVSIYAQASSEVTVLPWRLAGPGRRFVVRDIGLGVHPDDTELIFKPYVQGRAYLYNRVIRGTGLGLAICKQIVEAHGGAISATSRPTPGSERRPSPENLHECVVEVFVDLPLKVPKTDGISDEGGKS